MGLKNKLLNKIVFVDTAPIIYFIEGHSVYQRSLTDIFNQNEKGKITFLTSTLTILEVLVQPIKMKRFDLAEEYEKILTTSSNIDIINIDPKISKAAAKLRADYGLKTPDAIQMASGVEFGADVFLTNDKKLTKVKEIEVITLIEE